MSIPLLLVLAGFNHAHGLTTFGKANNQGQNNHQQPAGLKKACTSQTNCTVIKGTTCLRGYCMCGDNTNPVNGACKALIKGPGHMCNTDNDCVDNADCLEPKEKGKLNNGSNNNNNNNNQPVDKICTCQEGFIESNNACSGSSQARIFSSLLAFGIFLLLTKEGLPANIVQ